MYAVERHLACIRYIFWAAVRKVQRRVVSGPFNFPQAPANALGLKYLVHFLILIMCSCDIPSHDSVFAR